MSRPSAWMRVRASAWTLVLLAAIPVLSGRSAGAAEEAAASSCVACHGAFAGEQVHRFREESVHAGVGLSCHDCHGGNPDPSVADDMAAAMDPGYAADPYRGAPSRAEEPAFCGRCHSDPAYMKRFGARTRTDQVRLYWTSGHGRGLADGDENVATCTDCHGVHDIRSPQRTASRVHATHVAETCASCHADPERMRGYGLPVDVYAEWRASVHATALLEKDDLAAPTCNDCHGNHGAAPPGIDRIAAICGTCHSREADLYRGSPKEAALEMHRTFTEAAGTSDCADCHSAPHPAAALKDVSLHGCIACHDNHAIFSSRVTMLSPLPETPCAYCHPEDRERIGAPLTSEPGVRFEDVRDQLLEQARSQGLEGDARFDWLLGQARRLSYHRRHASENGRLEAEVARLMRRLRVAGTRERHADPHGEGRVVEPVRRCGSCHPKGSTGYEVSTGFQRAIQEVSATAARAERVLLAAERGGVSVGQADQRFDQAVDATVELVALVHAFSAEEGDGFDRRHQEALTEGRAAIDAARDALEELGARRQGLLVVLALILAVGVLVALKIRQLERERSGS